MCVHGFLAGQMVRVELPPADQPSWASYAYLNPTRGARSGIVAGVRQAHHWLYSAFQFAMVKLNEPAAVKKHHLAAPSTVKSPYQDEKQIPGYAHPTLRYKVNPEEASQLRLSPEEHSPDAPATQTVPLSGVLRSDLIDWQVTFAPAAVLSFAADPTHTQNYLYLAAKISLAVRRKAEAGEKPDDKKHAPVIRIERDSAADKPRESKNKVSFICHNS